MGSVNIKSVKIYHYSLPLRKPVQIKGRSLKSREGLILRITADNTVEGFGEIAPLPGFSKETLEKAQAQTIQTKSFLLNQEITDHYLKLNGALNKLLANLKLLPSVQYGIEMTILNLLTNAQEKPLYKFLSANTHDYVRISGLLTGSKEEVKQQAQKLIAEGYKDLKLKVSANIDDEINRVNAINEMINGHALLHLDANQSWSIADAVKFGNEVGCAAVEYIEEPFKDLSLIPEFFHKTTIPAALDETLQEKDFNEIKSIEGVDILVLKPNMIGSIDQTSDIAQKAQKLAFETTISSSFESSIGILALANLSAKCSSHDRAAGLDTLKWFEQDLLNEPLNIEKGKIDISKRRITAADVNFDLLTEIK